MKARKLLVSLWMGTVTLLAAEGESAAPPPLFPDPALEAVVRQQVFAKRDNQEPLVMADVANVSIVQGNFRGIRSLEGLQHCKALASVELAGNRIDDLGPLAGLRRLQFVHLASNRVDDISALGTLPSLQYIQLEHNAVTRLDALAANTNLASVYVSHNKVASLAPLTGLPRLVTLYADGNQIDSLEGIGNLRGLTLLSAGNNHIADLSPLQGLRAPSFIRLTTNRISDLGPLRAALLKDMESGRRWAPFVRLYLDGNPLSPEGMEQRRELEGRGIRFLP